MGNNIKYYKYYLFSLWDNLEIDRIIEIVNENIKCFPCINPQDLANKIAEEAEEKSKSE